MASHHGHAHTTVEGIETLMPRTVKLSDSKMQALADAMLSGVKTTGAVVSLGTHLDKDARCFRGKKLVEFLMDPAIRKAHADVLGPIHTQADAEAAAQKLLVWRDASGFRLFAACDRLVDQKTRLGAKVVGSGQRLFTPFPPSHPRSHTFAVPAGTAGQLSGDEDARYYFVYQGNKMKVRLWTAFLLFCVLAACFYPLWPTAARTVIWYILVSFILFLLALTIIQHAVFSLCWVFGWSIWITPNLWADVAITEIFTPALTVERSKGSPAWARVALLGTLALSVWWMSSQVTDFDAFLADQKTILSDIYEGKLLSDGSETMGAGGKNNLLHNIAFGKRKAIPALDQLDKLFEEVGAAETLTTPTSTEGEEGAAPGGEAAAAAAALEDEVLPPPAEPEPDMDAMLNADEAGGEEL